MKLKFKEITISKEVWNKLKKLQIKKGINSFSGIIVYLLEIEKGFEKLKV